MKRQLFLLLVMCALNAVAQDVIVKNDGGSIPCKVLYLTTDDVVYKDWANLDGADCTISRVEVSAINYENDKSKDKKRGKEKKEKQKKEKKNKKDKQGKGSEQAQLFSYQSGVSEKDQYRRSSLTLILVNHSDKKYSNEMARVFMNFPLPARYNEHPITDVQLINVVGKQSKKDIDRLLKNNHVARKVVAKWFDRNSQTGQMDMDLIHERGGYGASYADYERSKMNVRGTAMLQDEGIELLQSTFVLVCDMDYMDKSKSFWKKFGEGVLAVAAIGSAVMSEMNYAQAQSEYSKGNYSAAQSKLSASQSWAAGSTLAATGAAIVADIGGFRVKINAYLYKLRWDDEMTGRMYNEYWIDDQTEYTESQVKKDRFERDEEVFQLDYVGSYKAASGKTILRSWSNEDDVILDVCERAVNKGMEKLAKKFPIFKPRAPFYFSDGVMFSHIGKKEDVAYGKKYEIVMPYKDKHGQICYKRVGKAKAGTPWDNQKIRFDQYFDTDAKGTMFYCNKGVMEHLVPGMQIREL